MDMDEIDDVYRLPDGRLLEVMLVRRDGVAECDIVEYPGLPALEQIEMPLAEPVPCLWVVL